MDNLLNKSSKSNFFTKSMSGIHKTSCDDRTNILKVVDLVLHTTTVLITMLLIKFYLLNDKRDHASQGEKSLLQKN